MRVVVVAVFLALACASPAQAQQNALLPAFVIDVRGVIARLGEDATTAAALGVAPQQLPTTGLGVAIGVNAYPLRRQKLSLGVGGEGVISRAVTEVKDATTGEVVGPRIERRFQGISGTVSLNFGHRQGWSYVSAGLGPVRLQSFTGNLPLASPPFAATLNFGAGARWFTSQHLAFCFDLRFYLTQAQEGTADYAGRDKHRVLAISAGIAIK